MTKERTDVLILAAGQGKRMRSQLVKVLHPLCGRPVLSYVIDLARALSPEETLVVVGRQEDAIRRVYRDEPIQFVSQPEQLGTGHAVSVTRKHLEGFDGDIVILSGDVPLLKIDTLNGLMTHHREQEAEATILTAVMENPEGYGRILREEGEVLGIVEEGDAPEELRAEREINTGIYVFSAPPLWSALDEIKPDNVQEEYYLTDTIKILKERGGRVGGFPAPDPEEARGINTRSDLAEARRVVQGRIKEALMLSGVTIVDPPSTEIDWGVKIGKDTVIHPFTSLRGKTVVGEGCEIGPHAVVLDSRIGREIKIGSFAHLKGGNLGEVNEE